MAAGKPAGPSISNETRPVQTSLNTDSRKINYSNTIYHNGVTFNFASGVTWGRYISGDPWVLVSGPGITLSSIEPGLTLVSSNISPHAGITFYINGSQKNKLPNAQDFQKFGITFPGYNKQAYDQRGSDTISSVRFTYAAIITYDATLGITNSTGLSYGDMIISSISSFNANTSTDPAAVEQRYHNNRSLIKQYSILTAVNQIPSIDSYRPPLYWSTPSTRPSFKESEYAQNVNNYLIDLFANKRTMTGATFSGNLNNSINAHSYLTEKFLQSSYVYDALGFNPIFNGGHDAIQPENNIYYPQMISGYGLSQLNLIWNPIFTAIFIKDIPYHLRLKALRRVVQFGIDQYGYMMSGGLNYQDGGHAAGCILPFIRFTGWLFNNTTMLNIHNNSTYTNYLRSGLTGASAFNPSFPKQLYNSDQDYFNKVFNFVEYSQKFLVYGFTASSNGEYNKWFNISNPSVMVPYDKGFTYSLGYPNGFTGPNLNTERRLFASNGWTGAGSIFKFGGITLNPETPASVLTTATIGDANGDYSSPISGKFGKLNLSNKFKPRNAGQYFPEIGSASRRANSSKSMLGLIVKIISGSGSGETEYRIINCKGIHSDDTYFPYDHTYNVELILDRNFQNGIPDSTSVIDIYPFSTTDKFPTPSYTIAPFYFDGITFTNSTNSSKQIYYTNARYSTNHYFTTNDVPLLKTYSILKHLGITQDQYIYNYHDMIYFDKNPRWTLLPKIFGTNENGAIPADGYDSLLISRLRGLTEGTYIGSMSATSGLDLPGFTA
jgi:hypothetical protein